jgi:hypothetical protein
MANGQVFTDRGRKVVLHRSFEASPTLTAPNWFSVGTGTTTPTEADTSLASLIQIGGADTKAIVNTYPLFDDTNLQVTIRALILTTECNSGSPTITEFGLKNNDGTPLLCSRTVFTGIAKTTSVQIIFVEKDKVT